MTFFEKAKYNYAIGAWSKAMLAKLVEKGKLTQEEYEEIVGTEQGEEN